MSNAKQLTLLIDQKHLINGDDYSKMEEILSERSSEKKDFEALPKSLIACVPAKVGDLIHDRLHEGNYGLQTFALWTHFVKLLNTEKTCFVSLSDCVEAFLCTYRAIKTCFESYDCEEQQYEPSERLEKDFNNITQVTTMMLEIVLDRYRLTHDEENRFQFALATIETDCFL